MSWEAFVERYRQEHHEQTTCTPIAYQVDTGEQVGSPVTTNTSPVGFLAELECRYGAMCCVCHEDLTKPGSHCHRTELVHLVRDFQAGGTH